MPYVAFYRFGFFLLFIIVGRYLGIQIGVDPLFSTIGSLFLGILFFTFEYLVATRKTKDMLAFLFGLSMAIIVSNGIAYLLTYLPLLSTRPFWVYLILNLAGIYIFGSFAYHKREELRLLNFFFTGPQRRWRGPIKILDTSVIIDGRILGVGKSGFLEGEVLIPRFVLRELQKVADSKDHIKRTKGRRGLDVLKELQGLETIQVIISPEDVSRSKEVDQKLIDLAKKKGGKILTTDFNLKKLADIHGVKVLNVNELSRELKPILIPGDVLNVKVVKPGKEEDQGVGYLEDGTMVVVESGAELIGQEVTTIVLTVLQTEAGRMIFTRPKRVGNNE